jgi:hypothetical protein
MNAIFKTGGDGVCVALRESPDTDEYALTINRRQLVFGLTPAYYRDNGGVFEPRSEADRAAYDAAFAAGVQAKRDRQEAIATARTDAGVRELTVEQAEAWLEEKINPDEALGPLLADYDAAATVADLKPAIRSLVMEIGQLFYRTQQVHKKEVPYILD